MATTETGFEYDGLRIRTHPDVYVPNEDSYLLAEHAATGPGTTVLELGCGAGVASLVAARSGARVLATDVNPGAVALLHRNARDNGLRVEGVVADLLDGIRIGRIDRLLTNPPYLPTATDERVRGPLNLAFDAGPDGMDLLRRLAAALADRRDELRTGFEAYVVVSTLQDLDWFHDRLQRARYDVTTTDTTRLPFEALVLLRVRPTP